MILSLLPGEGGGGRGRGRGRGGTELRREEWKEDNDRRIKNKAKKKVEETSERKELGDGYIED